MLTLMDYLVDENKVIFEKRVVNNSFFNLHINHIRF